MSDILTRAQAMLAHPEKGYRATPLRGLVFELMGRVRELESGAVVTPYTPPPIRSTLRVEVTCRVCGKRTTVPINSPAVCLAPGCLEVFDEGGLDG